MDCSAINTFVNDTQPAQVIPSSLINVTIIGFYVSVFPEGVEIAVGIPGASKPSPQLATAFDEGRAKLGRTLPAARPQPCCTGGAILNVYLADGQRASYGPCDRPVVIDQIINDLYSAADSAV